MYDSVTFEEREAEYLEKIARLEEENNKLKSRLKEYEENEDNTEKTVRDYLTKYGVK